MNRMGTPAVAGIAACGIGVDSTQPDPEDQIGKLILGYRSAKILFVAVTHNLFEQLRSGSQPAEWLAVALALDVGACTVWLDALVALGFLEKGLEGYRNSDVARQFLLKDAPQSLYYNLCYQDLVWEGWSALGTCLTTRPPPEDLPTLLANPGFTISYIEAMREIASRPSAEVWPFGNRCNWVYTGASYSIRSSVPMRLHLLLPPVQPGPLPPPTVCPTPDCPGTTFRFHQAVRKPLRDTRYSHVFAARYQCLTCRHTFRVYPVGVSAAQTSQRVRGLAVMFYLLGLSYGATALALEALGVPLAKSTIYEAVQAAAARLPDLRQSAVFAALRTPAVGADLTSVLCNGEWLTLGLAVDAVGGLTLSIDLLAGSDAATIQAWLAPIVAATGADLLVTDDADSMKRAAEDLGLQQQVCKAHVRRNTEALVAELLEQVAGDPDGSLAAVGVSVAQAQADLRRLAEVVRERQPRQGYEVDVLHQRYKDAPAPRAGEKWSLAYRLRQLFLDRAQLWNRLTRYRTWQGPGGERIDGTNNASERGIGWWIKERYRGMRGYKRAQSAVNVSRLVAWAGNALGRAGAELATVVG